jgi:hypothetical protein
VGELVEDPAFCRVEGELDLFRLEALVNCDDTFELSKIGVGVERQLFDQPPNRGGSFRWWRGHLSKLLSHQNSSLSS